MAPTRLGDGTNIDSIRLGDGTEIAEVRTGAGDVVFSAGPNLQDLVQVNNLVAWYPLDGNSYDETRSGGILDSAGVNVGDSTDYSATNNGVSFQPGGVNDYTNGQYGMFDGNDNLRIDNKNLGSNYIFGTNWSIGAWARADTNYSSSNNHYIVDGGRWDRVSFGWNTYYEGPGYYNANIYDGDRKIVGSNSPYQSPNAGTWLHHVFTYDGTMRYYINGVLQGSVGQGNPNTSADYVTIGSNSNSANNEAYYWQGGIDDVRFYNTVLTATEVDQIYQNTKP